MKLKKIYAFLLDMIYPRRATCMGCGDMLGCDRDDLCEDCRNALAKNWIGPRMPDPKLRLDGAAYAHYYAGTAGSLVRRLKYSGVHVLAEEMGKDIARAAALLRLGQNAVVVPVPMHPRRKRKRGGNHSELLARVVAAELNLDCREWIVRTRNTPQQARLENEERRQNLNGAFLAQDLPPHAEILLIDDVFTTGTTAMQCAKALRAAGAERVYFAAYALGNTKQEKKNG